MALRNYLIIASIIGILVGLSTSIHGHKNNQVSQPPEESTEAIELEIEKILIDLETNIETPAIKENELTKSAIESLAKSITVKVLSGENSGSGILIKKKDDLYTIVTNDHVLIFGQEDNNYQIVTSDGQKHDAEILKNIDFHSNDLGLLTFQSNKNYPIIDLTVSAKAILGNTVYAAGFPYNIDNNYQSISEQFAFTEGKINMISELSFRGGYQIGYTNKIQKGMSGGPILNNQGKIIGINGRHKYPLWGNPYVFEDGSIANPEKKAEMSQLSWGIPIQTFLKFNGELAQKLP